MQTRQNEGVKNRRRGPSAGGEEMNPEYPRTVSTMGYVRPTDRLCVIRSKSKWEFKMDSVIQALHALGAMRDDQLYEHRIRYWQQHVSHSMLRKVRPIGQLYVLVVWCTTNLDQLSSVRSLKKIAG